MCLKLVPKADIIAGRFRPVTRRGILQMKDTFQRGGILHHEAMYVLPIECAEDGTPQYEAIGKIQFAQQQPNKQFQQ